MVLGNALHVLSLLTLLASYVTHAPAAPATPALGAATTRGAPAAIELLDESFQDNSAGWPIGTHRYFAADGYHVVAEGDELGA